MENLINFFKHVLFSYNNFQLTLAQVIAGILVLLSGFVVYKLLNHKISKAKATDRFSKKQVKTLLKFIRLIILFATIIFFFKAIDINTTKVMGFDIIDTKRVTFSIYHLLILYFVFTGTRILIYLLEVFFNDRVNANKIEKGKGQSLFQIVKYFVWIIAITLFLDSLGFSITFLIASLSALLVGLGLGIQHFFNDIISGIIILFDRSVKVDDIVEIPGEMVGKVSEISLRTSKLISRDDVVVIIPNSMFTSDRVINWSHNSFKTRFNVEVGVAYGSDVEKVKQLLIEAAKAQPKVEIQPAPTVLFKDFGDSSLNFEVLFHTNESFRVERIKSDIRFTINQKFLENNITIPFPQRDVHLKQTK